MNKRLQKAIVLVILAAAVSFNQHNKIAKRNYNTAGPVIIEPAIYKSIRVTRVIDGDTLKLENGQKVRLIGIDCPELEYGPKLYRDSKKTGQDVETIRAMGRKAKQFTAGIAEDRKIRLEFDAQATDKYGRLLAYVYVPGQDKEIFLNSYLVEQGYASLMTIPPNVRYAGLFKKLYVQARNNNRGLWAK